MISNSGSVLRAFSNSSGPPVIISFIASCILGCCRRSMISGLLMSVCMISGSMPPGAPPSSDGPDDMKRGETGFTAARLLVVGAIVKASALLRAAMTIIRLKARGDIMLKLKIMIYAESNDRPKKKLRWYPDDVAAFNIGGVEIHFTTVKREESKSKFVCSSSVPKVDTTRMPNNETLSLKV